MTVMKENWGKDILEDLDRAARIEWLETNGLGGYAMSTVVGMNTRRYHGLLVAALHPPVARHVLLSKLEDVLNVGGKSFECSCNRYPGVVHPAGHLLQERFTRDLFPAFFYRAGEARLEKTLALIHGRNTLIVRYRVINAPAFALRVRPFLAFRDAHHLTSENGALQGGASVDSMGVTFKPYAALPALSLRSTGGRYREEGFWVKNLEYLEEAERGLPDREDAYSPGEIVWRGMGGGIFYLIASLEPMAEGDPAALLEAERERRRALVGDLSRSADGVLSIGLGEAADAFIVRRGKSRRTVIAGYPWFTDWGRDAMIGLSGLTLLSRRFDIARDILLGFSEYLDQGMIPNRFPDHGENPEYNTADATLWFIHAIEEYRRASGDLELIKALYPALTEVVKWHIKGTHFGIRMDPADHLLSIGGDGLTWMDARTGDGWVTPRSGKAVEINALWYRALTLMAWWTRHLGSRINPYLDLARQVRESFDRRFWCEAGGYLFDVVDGDMGNDASLRPNQLFALGLAEDLVPKVHAVKILERVRENLLTPYGLRTLSPKDSRYRGRYEGDPCSRDGAYHQGTVWPWLLGVYADAVMNVEGRTVQSVESLRGILEPFRDHLGTAGIGSVSEIFDGDPPHRPRGCPAQAWSVAELLRVSAMVQHS